MIVPRGWTTVGGGGAGAGAGGGGVVGVPRQPWTCATKRVCTGAWWSAPAALAAVGDSVAVARASWTV